MHLGAGPGVKEVDAKIVQQPQRARMCGFSPADRRPIHPPPVLQIIPKGKMDLALAGLLVGVVSLVSVSSLKSPTSASKELNEDGDLTLEIDPSSIPVVPEKPSHSSQSLSSPFTSASTSSHPQPDSMLQRNLEAPTSTSSSMSQKSLPTKKSDGHILPTSSSSHATTASTSSLHSSPQPQADDAPPPYVNEKISLPPPPPPPPSTHQFTPGLHTISSGLQFIASQVLLGSLVVPCSILFDPKGVRGLYCVFHDLAVRSSGSYRLKFDVFDISMAKYHHLPLASAISDIFIVYSPKTFPGITETTELSRCFAKQGVRIRIRPNADLD